MLQSLISKFVHAEIQHLQLWGLGQGFGQVFTGLWAQFAPLQPEPFQLAVLVAQPLHKVHDSDVLDAVVSQIQLSQVRLLCAQDSC